MLMKVDEVYEFVTYMFVNITYGTCYVAYMNALPVLVCLRFFTPR